MGAGLNVKVSLALANLFVIEVLNSTACAFAQEHRFFASVLFFMPL